MKLVELPISWKRGSGFKKSDVNSSGKNFVILYGELFTKHKNVLIDKNSLSRTDKEGSVRSEAGDILVPGTSTASRRDIILARELDIEGVYIGGDINIIRPSKGIFAPKFLAYMFEMDATYRQLDQYVTGATGIIHISNAGLKNLNITVPSLDKQRSIVAKLDEATEAIDQAIHLTKQNILNINTLYNSSFYALINNVSGIEIVLSEVCDIDTKLVDPREDPYLNQVHIGAANIKTATGKLHSLKTAKEERLISGKFPFDENTVLYSKIRPYLMKVARPVFSGICSADIYPLSARDSIDKNYLFYLLLSPDFTQYAISGSDRAGMPKVNRNHLFAYRFNLPDKAYQTEIVNKLDSLLKAKTSITDLYNKKLEYLTALKQSILRQCFTESAVK